MNIRIPTDPPNFACTWCGARFARRHDLDRHWSDSPECSRNRSVSSPLLKDRPLPPDEREPA